MGFKFFQHEKDEFERMLEIYFPGGAPEGLDDDFPGLPEYEPLPVSTSVILRVPRNRDDISDEIFGDLCKAQRLQLIEKMWLQRQVTQTIISQDENGFTLRTEILNF